MTYSRALRGFNLFWRRININPHWVGVGVGGGDGKEKCNNTHKIGAPLSFSHKPKNPTQKILKTTVHLCE
jgi:hypothetical protein